MSGPVSDAEEPVGRRTTRATVGDRIAAFAMLDAMGEATQAQRAFRLALVGFSNGEIAEMLQTTTATVSQALYAERKRAKARERPGKRS